MPTRGLWETARGWFSLKSVQAPTNVREQFHLTLNNLTIGTLTAENGIWRFEYSNAFRQNDVLRPLVEFPDVNKVYEQRDLWQFFASRIPSMEQAEVEAIMRSEAIDEDDSVTLLKRFGQRTITNPFELKAA